MTDLAKNKLTWVAGGLLVVVILIALDHLIVDRVANRVIHKLTREYSPSPYGPGVDPDVIDPERFKKK